MLIDELITFASQSSHDPYNLREALPMALRFQVDNVAHYVYEEGLPESHVFHIAQRIPNMAPLAPVMWFEYDGSSVGKNPLKGFGCLVSIAYDRKESPIPEWHNHELHADIRWLLRFQCFFRLPHGHCATNWIHYLALNDEGGETDFIGRERSIWGVKASVYDDANAPEYELYVEEIIALFAICFAHCKGTEIEEHKPSRQVRRAAERAGKPVFTFHIIDIEPSRKVLRTEGHISENGLAKALHICRGHFAHYTAEKPLFGKLTGTFYRPMHVRGSAESGIAVKDYRIHPTQEEATKV